MNRGTRTVILMVGPEPVPERRADWEGVVSVLGTEY